MYHSWIIHCERHFSLRLPPSGGTLKYAKAPGTKKTWRDSLPIDMLLSAVSVLVVAQSSSEIPEGLMNNPVFSCIVKQLYKRDVYEYFIWGPDLGHRFLILLCSGGYIIVSLHFWNLRPDDGCLVQPKHVAHFLYTKLCIDGLYPYCCVILHYLLYGLPFGCSHLSSSESLAWDKITLQYTCWLYAEMRYRMSWRWSQCRFYVGESQRHQDVLF